MKKLVLPVLIVILFSSYSYALRVVSLSPATTEVLFKLGAGNEVVGDTLFSNYPKDAKTLPKVGSYIHPNLEKILELHPDYVIGMREGMDRRVKTKLNELGIKSIFYRAKNIKDIIFMIKNIAKIVNRNSRPIIKKIEHFYKVFPPEKKTAIFLVSVEPFIASTQNTFINSIMRCAGIKNIVKGDNLEFIIIDKEFIVRSQPDYIVFSIGIKKQIDEVEAFIKRFHLHSKLLIVNPNIYDRPSYRVVNACLDLRKKTVSH